jgi:FkbM family methyltransferase
MFVKVHNGRYLTLDIKRSGEKIHTIFDVGANIGQTCLTLIKAYPQATIYSFEPVATTYLQLKINTKKYPGIKCIELALGAKKEKLKIISQQNTEINSLRTVAKHDNRETANISVETAAVFCKDNAITFIDLLKIDTEGFEIEVLKGFNVSFLKDNVKFIFVETGFDRSDIFKTHYSDIEQYLTALGFITSGFYDSFLWGKAKLRLGFCNVLFTNSNFLKD